MSSFVTEVLANAGRLEKVDLDAKLGALSKKMAELKMEIYDSLQKKYEAFYPNFETAVNLSERVQQLSHEMEAVANKVEKDTQAQLKMSAKEFQNLSAQLHESNIVLKVLDRLFRLDRAWQEFDEYIKVGKYQLAVTSLTEVHRILTAESCPRDDNIKILQALSKKYSFEKEKLISDVTKAWLDTVRWDLGKAPVFKEKNNTSLHISLCISSNRKERETTEQLVQAMQDLGILYPKINNFGDRFLKSVVEPIVSSSDVEIRVETSGTGSSLILVGEKAVKCKTDRVPPDICMDKLVTAIRFLHQSLFDQEVSVQKEELENGDPEQGKIMRLSLMSLLGSFIGEQLVELVINQCLACSIPSSSKDLDSFSGVIRKTESFQSTLAAEQFLPPDNNSLVNFVNDVDVLFANKKCRELLENARLLMTNEIHNMTYITPISSDDLPPVVLQGMAGKHSRLEGITFSAEKQLSSKTFHLPACYISESVKKLVDLAYDTLNEAVCAQSSVQYSIQLFYSVRNIFLLYCDVVPTYHRESLDNLPQIIALCHNNSVYIAHHLLTMGHQFRRGLPSPLKDGAAIFIDLVPKLRRLGTDVFLRQMAKQRDLILDSLNTAEGFASVSEDGNQKAEKAIRQVLYQLQRLHNLWNKVLPVRVLHNSMGTLLNTAIGEIISKVTSLEDISADDADELYSLMSMIRERAPGFFEVESLDGKLADTKSQLHASVEKWSTFLELMWMLNASLQDIGEHWADGKGPLAAELPAAKVKQLIRALFQNTEKRSKILASIK